MARELCLVMDEKGYERLVLKTGSDYEIDKFTSKYDNAEQIRKAFSKLISEYLSKFNGNYNGRIVVVDTDKIGSDYTKYQKKVIYKKYVVVFKKVLKKKENFMKKLVSYEFKNGNASKHIYDTINYNFKRSGSSTIINGWIRELNDNSMFYEVVRDAMTIYGTYSKEHNLESVDELYKALILKPLKNKKMVVDRTPHEIVGEVAVSSLENSLDGLRCEEMVRIGDYKYSTDELHLFEGEELLKEDVKDYLPDGLGRNIKR